MTGVGPLSGSPSVGDRAGLAPVDVVAGQVAARRRPASRARRASRPAVGRERTGRGRDRVVRDRAVDPAGIADEGRIRWASSRRARVVPPPSSIDQAATRCGGVGGDGLGSGRGGSRGRSGRRPDPGLVEDAVEGAARAALPSPEIAVAEPDGSRPGRVRQDVAESPARPRDGRSGRAARWSRRRSRRRGTRSRPRGRSCRSPGGWSRRRRPGGRRRGRRSGRRGRGTSRAGRRRRVRHRGSPAG